MANTMQFTNPPPTMTLPNLSVPPPTTTNLSAPPPNLTMINPTTNYQPRFPNHRDVNRSNFFKPFRPYHPPKVMSGGDLEALQDEFDGKRLRKSVMRKTVDYNSSIIKTIENRTWQRDFRDRRALQPDVLYYPDLLPPPSYIDNPINAVTTRFVKTATNKMRCPIFCMAWTPEGRRLVTGASSGEFTLWNGLTFNFETILQAHESPVRTMVWSHNESWMVTGDHAGFVKYWQSNMNNVKMFQAHKEAVRGLSFSPTDHKLVTCSDDGTVRIWDFLRCYEERILRGHGADVKCVHWHPQKSLIISGSKDNQQPVKLWDPKTGSSITTLHAHKSTVMDVKWNENGNWLVTASRDHLLKLFDLRNLSQEVQTFRGHKKEASSVAWHPCHEGLFCSGGSDGAILFWHVGADKEVGAIEQAHDSIVWTLAWHPLGHILCSGSNDHTSKFWTRNRPGDSMRDKYNLNTLPAGAGGVDDHEVADEAAIIPGMGPEDRINTDNEIEPKNGEIPGLDLDPNSEEGKKAASKKVPYSKPIPRNFQAQWNEIEGEENTEQVEALNAIVNQLIETTPGAVPLNDVTPEAIILYGRVIPVEAGSKLAEAVTQGAEAINNLVLAGEIEELKDVIKTFNNEEEEEEDTEDYLHDDNEINFAKIPKVELPPPLPSSKFAQNPDLMKVLKFGGGKREFEQLIGRTNQPDAEKGTKPNQFFTSSFAEESQSSDTDMRYTSSSANNFNAYDDKSMDLDDQDFRYKSGGGSDRFGESYGGSRNNFEDTDYRQSNASYSSYNDRDYNSDKSWDEDSRNEDSNYSQDNNYNKRDESGESGNNAPFNHFKMQGLNTNIPPPNLSKPPPLAGKLGPPRMDVPPPHMMPHHNMPPPPFRPNGPPPPIPGNFRGPPPNAGFNPNMPFRPGMTPFSNSFNNFPGPPPFRPPNFDRNNFGGNFKGQNKQGPPPGRMFRPRNPRGGG